MIHIEKHEAVRDELTRTKEALKLAGDEGADAAALRVKSKNLQDKIDLLEQLMEQVSQRGKTYSGSKSALTSI